VAVVHSEHELLEAPAREGLLQAALAAHVAEEGAPAGIVHHADIIMCPRSFLGADRGEVSGQGVQRLEATVHEGTWGRGAASITQAIAATRTPGVACAMPKFDDAAVVAWPPHAHMLKLLGDRKTSLKRITCPVRQQG
jgi:hypothetical protein